MLSALFLGVGMRVGILYLPGAIKPKLLFWLSPRVNVAAAEEAVTPRWLPGGAPHEPSHCLQLPHHSLQRPQSW